MVEIFLDTAPHMRGTVTPPLRGGGHLLQRLFVCAMYVGVGRSRSLVDR